MSEQLKPCPFCGGEVLKTGGDYKVVGVWCLNCQCAGPNHYGGHEWNDRTDLSLAHVAAKLEEAADVDMIEQAISDMAHENLGHREQADYVSECIRALIDTDAQAALDAVRAEERERCAGLVLSKMYRAPGSVTEVDRDFDHNEQVYELAAAIREAGHE